MFDFNVVEFNVDFNVVGDRYVGYVLKWMNGKLAAAFATTKRITKGQVGEF